MLRVWVWSNARRCATKRYVDFNAFLQRPHRRLRGAQLLEGHPPERRTDQGAGTERQRVLLAHRGLGQVPPRDHDHNADRAIAADRGRSTSPRWGSVGTMNLGQPVSLRSLTPADYPVARRLVATAFAGEPFAVGMFGESPLDRFAGMTREYSTWPWQSNPVAIAADVGGALVGVAVATLPGACHLCDGFDETEHPQSTRAEQIEYQFQLASRNAHQSQHLPPHAHIATVVTDLFLRGCGVGERVVHELTERLWAAGVVCAVLECLTTRERFYERAGFRRIADFADPGGPTLRSVLMRVDRP